MEHRTDAAEESSISSRLARRRKTVLATAIAAALMSVGGLVGAAFVQSPSQAAADSRPPQASVITAPVTNQILRSTVVLRGVFGDGKTVSASPTSVAATANNPGGASPVVSGVFVKAGQQVKAAQPLVEFSGRPVFVLPGAVPAYRDLLPGESGEDVAQLQKALKSLGYGLGGDTSGTFGAGTKSALRRLYQHMGYPVPVTGAATAAAVKSAQQQVDQLRASLATAGSQPSTGATSRAASTPSTGATSPSQEASSGPAPGTGSLRQQLAQAEEALAQAEAVDGPMLPASEVVFVPSLPARVASVPVSVGDPVKGPVVTLAHGGLQLIGALDPSDGGLVKPGMQAQIVAEGLGIQGVGTVTSIGALITPAAPGNAAGGSQSAAQQGVDNGGAAYLPLVIKPTGSWDARLAGQDVRITVTAAATPGPVLAVPEAAISAGANAMTTVTVQSASGGQRQVAVRTGASADGLVQVTPMPGNQLAAGDRVVVGQ